MTPSTPSLPVPGLPRRRLRGDTRAVVTGAGSGIGRAFALELAARGAAVVCSDIDESAAQATADAVTAAGASAGGKGFAARCDVASLEEVQALADAASGWFGAAPTLVINNAGVGQGGQVIGEVPIEDWAWTLGINLWGPVHGCHVFAPILREAGHGGIINVASAASFGAAPTMGPYNVSKAGVVSLSETLAAELSGTGVRVTVLCPTFVKTNIFDSGRITSGSTELGTRLMRLTGMPAERVARTCLDTHERGGLYCMPQFDAKLGWRLKRSAPAAYTRAIGLAGRVGPLRQARTQEGK